MARTMQHYVDHFEDAPVLVLPCLVRYRAPVPTEGASIYPACQNLLLAARALGYGGVMTGFQTFVESELRALLDIPDEAFLAARSRSASRSAGTDRSAGGRSGARLRGNVGTLARLGRRPTQGAAHRGGPAQESTDLAHRDRGAMDRINHVKLVTPEPELVDAFLREVCEIPEGWPLGTQANDAGPGPLVPLGPGGELSMDDVMVQRGGSETVGFITGDSTSRQFQILKSSGDAAFWAICIGTRNIEGAHEKCLARGIPATPITVADWNERDNIRNFFCRVGGLTFEVIRVE